MPIATTEKASILALFALAWPRHRAKRAARAANAPLATAKAWCAGRFIPSADTLLRMAQEDEDLAHALLASLRAHPPAGKPAAGAGEAAARHGAAAAVTP